ncbi:MAG TPA: hypothetical protein VHV51_04570, partial [Polyangiaceae bacterium]|nr:hypothetical protein [Polyangiaceae bacterium]
MLRSISSYARELRPALGAGIFAPARSRLWWLPVHAMVIASGILLLARHALPWPLIPAISLLIGLSFSGLTFLGHETLHGAIVRGRHLRRLVGWL